MWICVAVCEGVEPTLAIIGILVVFYVDSGYLLIGI